MSGSKHKEGAWEFVEFLLTRDDMGAISGFPSRRDILMKLLEEEMTPEYCLTEDGEVMTWDGEPRLDWKSGYVCGQEIIYYYYTTQKQADALLEMLGALDFTPEGGIRREIIEMMFPVCLFRHSQSSHLRALLFSYLHADKNHSILQGGNQCISDSRPLGVPGGRTF